MPATYSRKPWPAEQSDRTRAVQDALSVSSGPVAAADLARQFQRARSSSVEEILEALVSLGLARRLRGGKYAAG